MSYKDVKDKQRKNELQTIDIAKRWVNAANQKNIEELVSLSDEKIEIAGPKGSGTGHQLLTEWIDRAGLTVSTIKIYAKGGTVVFEQQGVWQDKEGKPIGEAEVSSHMKIENGKVSYLSRYDDLEQALKAAGLTSEDRKNVH